MTYNISLDGTIQVNTALINTDSNLPILLGFGTNLIINSDNIYVARLARVAPDNYQDKNTYILVGQSEAEFTDLYSPYIRPHKDEYKKETRWINFKNSRGKGIQITKENPIGFSLYHQCNSHFGTGVTKE